MIVQIRGVSVQIICRRITIDEISIDFVNHKDEVVAVFPVKSVDKVIDMGKVIYNHIVGTVPC